MNVEDNSKPWETLEALIEEGKAQRLDDYLDSLPPGEAARALAHLRKADRSRMIETLSPDDAATLIEELPEQTAGRPETHGN